MINVLSFGHIPSWAGGKQESGLANVIYQLAYHMSQHDGINITLGATDVYQKSLSKNKLNILGWTRGLLLRYILKHPCVLLKASLFSLYFGIKYTGVVSILGTCLKMIFLHYTICCTKPDVLHLHGMLACLYLKIVPHSVKVIVTIHGTCGGDSNLRNFKTMSKLEAKLCKSTRIAFLIFVAEGVRNEYIRLYGTIKPQTKIILNAYDGQSFYFVQKDKDDVMCLDQKGHSLFALNTLAALSERKGQKRVLEGIVKSKKSFSYSCIGSDTEGLATELDSFAYKHKIPFTYYGKRKPSEIRELLKEVDFMIMPSSSEGFGLSYLEAMACGIPVILPQNLPIVNERGIILPSINSILLEDCSADSIAKCLVNIESYDFDRKTVADSVLPFTWNAISKQYVDVLTTFNYIK